MATAKVKKYGNAVVIILNKTERELHGIKVGDIIEYKIENVLNKSKFPVKKKVK